MKRILSIIFAAAMLAACHPVPQEPATPRGNFEALWHAIDEHYCFFEEKDIDWAETGRRYAAQISDDMTGEELFNVCAAMLNELRDGHVNLSCAFATSYYRQWWSLYPQNFSMRLIQQSYFNFNYISVGAITYGLLPENIGYMHYSTFSSPIGEGNLDNILAYLSTADGLIIDVRDNGGGNLTNVETLVARFITEPTLVGYISHKTGPGHDDFSEPHAIVYNPAGEGRVRWGKPVVILTNRSTFSAANNFVSIMKNLPGVRIVGATTGGGSGMPYSTELPNGWGVRMSACVMSDAQGCVSEGGVEPTEGCAVDMDVDAALDGHDTILDFSIELLKNS